MSPRHVDLESADVQLLLAAVESLAQQNRSHAQNVRARFHDAESASLASLYDDNAHAAERVFATVQRQTLAFDNVTWGV